MSSSEIYVVVWAICTRYILPAIVMLALIGLVAYLATRKAVRDELRTPRSRSEELSSNSSEPEQ